jgi:addiction module HigA family antidote
MSERGRDYFEKSPPHPGKILRTEFLEPLEMTRTELAERLDVPFPRVNEIVNKKRSVTPETAIMLEKLFEVSAAFWLDLQKEYDLYKAYHGPAYEKAKDIRSVA